MGGVHPGCIGQGQQLFAQGIVEHAREFVLGHTFRGHQIRPAHIADEQRVAGEHALRHIGT